MVMCYDYHSKVCGWLSTECILVHRGFEYSSNIQRCNACFLPFDLRLRFYLERKFGTSSTTKITN